VEYTNSGKIRCSGPKLIKFSSIQEFYKPIQQFDIDKTTSDIHLKLHMHWNS